MKNATLPPLRVDAGLRAEIESVLHEGETLSCFMLEAVRLHVVRRDTQCEFIARGLRARDLGRQTQDYVSDGEMLNRLDEVLAQARHKAGSA